MTTDTQADRRIQKNLTALREAFFELVMTYSYDEIKVSDIIEKANVGRSTFYQHFKSKENKLQLRLQAESTKPHIPINLVAHQITESQLVIIIDWLTGRGSCTQTRMAEHVERTTKALCDVYLVN